jgi:hypothetical protein
MEAAATIPVEKRKRINIVGIFRLTHPLFSDTLYRLHVSARLGHHQAFVVVLTCSLYNVSENKGCVRRNISTILIYNTPGWITLNFKRKRISYVGLFFIASVCKRNTFSLFDSSAVSSWDDLLIIRSSFIQNTVLCVVARFRCFGRYQYFEGTLSMFPHIHVSTRPHFEGTFCLHRHMVIFWRNSLWPFSLVHISCNPPTWRKYILTVITSARSFAQFLSPRIMR